jgi:putative ABC transport system ATP-binding protein
MQSALAMNGQIAATVSDVDRFPGRWATELEDIRFGWRLDAPPVLSIDSMRIDHGKRVFLHGPSGSGKTTLLSLLAGIVVPQEGVLTILDRRVDAMTGPRRDRFRADHIGYIFQMFNLVPYLSVIENVTLPLRFSKKRLQKAGGHAATAEAVRLLNHLGMGDDDLLHRSVTELSVGQQQRVAAARALIGAPELVIADEPTSALDTDNREGFIDLLFQECARNRTTLIFVSHDGGLAGLFDQRIELPAAQNSQPMSRRKEPSR